MNANTASESTPPSVTGTQRRRTLVIGAIVLIVAGIAGALWFEQSQQYVTTEDAYVDGNAIQVTSQISGTVTSINADDTDHVSVGMPLVKLNPVDQKVQFERAKATLARATRTARTEYYQVQQLQQEVEQRQTDLRKALDDVARRNQVISSGAVSREELTHTQETLTNAKAALQASRDALAEKAALVDNTTLRTHPDVLVAASNLRDAYVALARTTIVSPVDGMVTKRSVQVGQRISPGMAMMSVVPLNALWVNANFKESQLEHLRIGQPVTLTADVYRSSVTYHGTIVGIDAGTGSAFALLPAQNATGNWIKVTQRVPVRIALDPNEISRNPLRVGLSMRISVDTKDRTGLAVRRDIAPETTYSTEVFDHELANADALVESIIRANEGVDQAHAAAHGAP